MRKFILFLLVFTSLFSCFSIYTSADSSEITPYYANVANATLSFSILPSGLAMAGVTYNGYSDVLTQVRCEITLQKRYLGLFWFDVDNGMPDNTWVDYSTNPYGVFYVLQDYEGPIFPFLPRPQHCIHNYLLKKLIHHRPYGYRLQYDTESAWILLDQ